MLEEFNIKKEFLYAFREPRNFFHHADKDPDKMVKFFSDTAWLTPLLASELFEKINNTQYWPRRVLMMWFYINNPVYMPKEMKPQIDALPYKGVKDDFSIFIELLDHKGN